MPSANERLTVSKPELLERGSDEAFRRLLYDMFAFANRLEDARARFASFIGLSSAQYMVLIALSHAGRDSEIGIGQIASNLHLSGAFITSEVNKLVQLKLVEKHPHPGDGRRVRLVATTLAFDMLTRLAPIQRKVNDTLFASMDRADFEHLGATMHRLAEGADIAIRLADHLTNA